MRKRRPDLVVTNTLVAPWAAFAAKTLGIPHAWFVREYGDLDHGFRFTQGRDATLSDIGVLSEMVFANSYAIQKHLSAYIPDDKLMVIYPQIDLSTVGAKSQELPAIVPFPAEDPGLRITVVGRLTPSKGQWRAVDAAGELHRRGIPVSLCFVGAKVEADADLSLMRRARMLGIGDRVVLAGERSNPFPYVAAADVAVMPSDNEAFGRTTVEYLSLGKPVLATRTGGSTEIIESGVNGFLFDGTHPGMLADDLALYARDPELVRKHGEAALASVARYTGDKHGNKAAIAALVKVAKTPKPYALPAVASYWFSLPALVSANPGNALTMTYLLGRLWRRMGSFSRNPLAAIRRRLRS
jgi:glycosyltransferase involved in cell wall biosynthesis